MTHCIALSTTDQVGAFGSDTIPSALRTLVLSTLILCVMFILDFRLACMITPLAPAFVLVRRSYRERLKGCSDAVQQQYRELASARQFASLSATQTRAQIRRRRMELMFSSLLYLMIIIGKASVLGYGGYHVITGSLSAGGLVAFYGYTLQLFGPLYGFVDIYSKLQRAGASPRRIMKVTKRHPTITEHPRAMSLPPDVLALSR